MKNREYSQKIIDKYKNVDFSKMSKNDKICFIANDEKRQRIIKLCHDLIIAQKNNRDKHAKTIRKRLRECEHYNALRTRTHVDKLYDEIEIYDDDEKNIFKNFVEREYAKIEKNAIAKHAKKTTKNVVKNDAKTKIA
jgi:hypothetical protein